MLLSNCESRELLPSFAENPFTVSLCSAIDELVRLIDKRLETLPCENSRRSLGFCRDDELAQIAEDLGVVPYYPDLERSLRENLIIQCKNWTRKAGTNIAISSTLNALFGTNTTTVNEQTQYRYSMNTEGFVDADEVSIRRFVECLEIMGHATCAPIDIVIHLESKMEQEACVGGVFSYHYERQIKQERR